MFALVVAASKDDQILSQYLAKIKTCRLVVDPTILAQINALKIRKMDMSAFLAHMKSNKISKREISLIESTFKAWGESKFLKVDLFEFQKIMSSLDKVEEKNARYTMLKPLLDSINNFKDPMLKNLFQFLFSLSTDNKAWTKKSSRKMLIYHPVQFKFGLNKINFEKIDYDQFLETLSIYLKQNLDKIDEPRLKKMVINQMDHIFYLPFGKKLDIDSAFSLSDIRQSIQSVIFGKPFFDYWFIRFNGRTSVDESLNVLSKNLTAQKLSQIEISRLWVLLYFISGDENWRAAMIDRIENLGKTDDVFLKDVFVSLLSDNIIKQELSKKNNEYSIPFFRLQRDSFRSCVQDRFYSQYCLFKLITIGDLDRDLIWFYILKKVGVINE